MGRKIETLIVGAGISGLTTAHLLQKVGQEEFLVLEGRNRIGGRILTIKDIDLGATWFQQHHLRLMDWLKKLGIPKHRQYQTGKSVFIYSSMAPAQYFDTGDPTNSAFRIVGGSEQFIHSLAKPIMDKIELNVKITHIEIQDNFMLVRSKDEEFTTKKLVLAIPPKLMGQLVFSPPLSPDVKNAMDQTHTWMSNAIKVGIRYKYPFWKEKGYSGTIIGHVCPTIELYDHSNYAESSFSLMGFVNEGLRNLNLAQRKKRVLDHIATQLGDEAYDYVDFLEKDWSEDQFTAGNGLNSIYMSPPYGHPIFQEAHFDNRLILSGAETAEIHGGYMDGAIRSGERSFQIIHEI